MAGGKASAKKISLADRRLLALELRRVSISYRNIANAIRREYPDRWPRYNESQAYKDVWSAVKAINRKTEAAAVDVLTLELLKLDDLESPQWDAARTGDIKAGRFILDIMERRAKYLDLDQVNKEDRDALRRWMGAEMSDEELMEIAAGKK